MITYEKDWNWRDREGHQNILKLKNLIYWKTIFMDVTEKIDRLSTDGGGKKGPVFQDRLKLTRYLL